MGLFDKVGRGGLFGSDPVSKLARAQALMQGDYMGAAQISQAMGAPQREAADRQREWEDFVKKETWKRNNPTPPGPNDTERDYELYERLLGPGGGKRFLESNINKPMAVDIQQADGSVIRQWVTPPPQQQGGAPQSVFQPGQTVNGYRFKGGDDTDPNAWEPVAQGGAGPSGPQTFPRPLSF